MFVFIVFIILDGALHLVTWLVGGAPATKQRFELRQFFFECASLFLVCLSPEVGVNSLQTTVRHCMSMPTSMLQQPTAAHIDSLAS